MADAPGHTGFLRVELGGRIFALRHGELLDADERVIPLRAKSARMLDYLIANHGRVIPKDDLAAAVWPDVTATDESIAQCVTDIRKALGDGDREIVETFPKRGYRLNATFPVPVQTRPNMPIVAAALVAALAIGFLYLATGLARDKAPTVDRRIVAVLPFSNEAGAELDYLATGMAEDLIFQLSEISRF